MRKIPWWVPKIGDEEMPFIAEALKNDFPNQGPLTEKFESQLKDLLGCKHAIAVTSGTTALFLALKALDIGAGDEVIVPDFTFIATANAVQMTGAKSILVDIDPVTLNMDVASFERAITPHTKAVIPVHVSGRGCNMEALTEISSTHNVKIVEDAAEALSSKYQGKFLGTLGALGCFSFSAHKTITTGQGGLIVTDDDGLAQKIVMLKDQGRPVRGTGGDDIHDEVGYNFKFTDLQAAVGLGQLKYLETRAGRMRAINSLYKERLTDVQQIKLLDFNKDELPQWTDALVEDRDQLVDHLAGKGIDCRKFWRPLHTQKPYKGADDLFPNATSNADKALWLPSAFTLEDSDIKNVCEEIKSFYG